MPRTRNTSRANSASTSTTSEINNHETMRQFINSNTPAFSGETRLPEAVQTTEQAPSALQQPGRSLSTSEVIKLLPEYDGSNIGLNDFAYECRSVFEMINPSEKLIMIKFVLSKIKGVARRVVEEKKYTNLEEIIADLARAFDSKNDYYSVCL